MAKKFTSFSSPKTFFQKHVNKNRGYFESSPQLDFCKVTNVTYYANLIPPRYLEICINILKCRFHEYNQSLQKTYHLIAFPSQGHQFRLDKLLFISTCHRSSRIVFSRFTSANFYLPQFIKYQSRSRLSSPQTKIQCICIPFPLSGYVTPLIALRRERIQKQCMQI